GFTGGSYFWLVKTDASGSHMWNQTYGGPSNDRAHSVIQTVDGGYALAGFTNSFGAGDFDFWLVKTDASGNYEWSQTYGKPSIDRAHSVIQTVDGGYAIVGYTWSFGAGNYDFWLVKMDSAGTHQWNQTYGGEGDDVGYSLVQTDDGGYTLTGYTSSLGAGGNDFWLVKTDASGSHEWNQTYGGPNYDEAYCMVQTVDGGYALAGYFTPLVFGPTDFWFVKTDQYGVIPEFPTWTPFLLLIILTAVITIYKQRARVRVDFIY
ncbi:MAG: hypothetical protein NWE78_08090, partial [Candidatus Bathyarchaeota archaeon]|nr:hypothetical protein [Candidatus Bathyarchaeota archaeon]